MKNLYLFFLICILINISINSFASTQQETRHISGFSAIEVSTGIDIYLTMGDTEKVLIEANNEIIKNIETKVENNVLKIYFNDQVKKKRKGKAYITLKKLKMLNVSDNSEVECFNTILSKNLEVKALSGSKVELNVITENLNLWASGSDVKLRGTTENFKAEASTGSELIASELEARNCRIKVNSGGDAIVNVSERLYITGGSGGSLKYLGSPRIIR